MRKSAECSSDQPQIRHQITFLVHSVSQTAAAYTPKKKKECQSVVNEYLQNSSPLKAISFKKAHIFKSTLYWLFSSRQAWHQHKEDTCPAAFLSDLARQTCSLARDQTKDPVQGGHSPVSRVVPNFCCRCSSDPGKQIEPLKD